MLIADSGFWLALANRRDRHHQLAKEKLETLTESLITTWPVMTETCHLLLNRLGTDAQLAFIRAYEARAFRAFPLEDKHAPRVAELMESYRDLPMDLADASLVLLAENLGHGRILSTDRRDFRTYRWKSHEPFQNILLD